MDTETAKCFFKNDRYAAMTGVEIVEVRTGYCKASLLVEDKHMNAANVVQGGRFLPLRILLLLLLQTVMVSLPLQSTLISPF